MRLVNSKGDDIHYLRVQEFNAGNPPRYAILSHIWEEDEVSFQEIKGSHATTRKKGYDKIRNCCTTARANGLEYAWVDTCCIDKTSSAELSEAINSMYRWYQDAEVCYAYLADISPTEGDSEIVRRDRISSSRWFRRGFTLQELIAPATIVFFDREWNELGTKGSLQYEISQRTNIPVSILSGIADLDDVCVAQRMSWAAGRETTRVEDRAYSLMGIFGINMPLLYGEGQMAFIRLQEEIIKILDDYSIFAWESDQTSYGGLLASSPDAFQNSGDIALTNRPFISSKSPWTITNKGIHLELPYVGVAPRGLGLAILPCGKLETDDISIPAIYLRDISLTMEQFERVGTDTLEFINPRLLPQCRTRQVCVKQRRVALASRRQHNAKTARWTHEHTGKETREVAFVSGVLRNLDLTLRRGLEEDNRTPRSGTPTQEGSTEGDALGWTSLFYAAAAGDVHQTRSCLARNNVRVDMVDQAGETPLSHAAKRGHVDVVWLLISWNDTMIHLRDKSGLTPFLHAARHGHALVLKMLLARLESRDVLVDGSGRTMLSHASERGHTAVVELLLAGNNAHPNQEFNLNSAPLLQAAKNGHEAVVKELLAHGADTETKDFPKKQTPLHWAAINADQPIARLLLAHGARTESIDNMSKTALHLAAINGSEPVVRLLLKHGANINAGNMYVKTPLQCAVINKHAPVVRLLEGAVVASGDHSAKSLPRTVREYLNRIR